MTLRSATSQLHQKVDAVMPLSRSSPSLQDYRHHLQLLARWVKDLAGMGVDRTRLDAEAHAIAVDLHECARLLGTTEITVPDQCAVKGHEPVATAAFRCGAQYVLEGSRLGAKFLHRKLAGPMAPHPLTYLSGAGWIREDAWLDFLSQLSRQVVTPVQIADACDGAKAAFSLLLQQSEASAGLQGGTLAPSAM